MCDENGFVVLHSLYGALNVGGEDVLWFDLFRVEKAVGGFCGFPLSAGFGDAGVRICGEIVNQLHQALI